MKSAYYLVLIAVLLASCSFAPSGDAVQTAIVQTEMARPTKTFVFNPTAIPIPEATNTPTPTDTPTSTPIPLSDIDLSSILVQPGDLPAGYSGAQIRSFPPNMFIDIPKPINQVYQQFEKNNESAGGVGVFVYDSKLDADNAYQIILNGMYEPDAIENIGERGQTTIMDFPAVGMESMDLLFLRCNTVVHIRLSGSTNQDYILSYAQRLDERLTQLVCR